MYCVGSFSIHQQQHCLTWDCYVKVTVTVRVAVLASQAACSPAEAAPVVERWQALQGQLESFQVRKAELLGRQARALNKTVLELRQKVDALSFCHSIQSAACCGAHYDG